MKKWAGTYASYFFAKMTSHGYDKLLKLYLIRMLNYVIGYQRLTAKRPIYEVSWKRYWVV